MASSKIYQYQKSMILGQHENEYENDWTSRKKINAKKLET